MEKQVENFPLILLAGGRSSRMGMPKGLLDYHGHPWMVEQLQRFKDASGKRAIIVLGFHQSPYFDQIPWLEKAVRQPQQRLGLEISAAINPAPEQGQFSSLQSAIALLKDKPSSLSELRTARPSLFDSLKAQSGLDLNSPMVLSKGSPKSPNSELISDVFILPIDVPCPGKGVFEKLVEAFGPSIDAAIPQYQSRGGHPVLLGSNFLGRLAEVPQASTSARLDLQIQALPVKRTAFVPVDDKNICLNMNSLDEFQEYTKREE